MRKLLLLSVGALAITTLAACDLASKPKTDNHDTATAHHLNKDHPMEYNTAGKTDADHLYLEEVLGDKALAKVTSWNERSEPLMQGDIYKAMKAELLEVYNSPEKIPYVSYRGGKAYNFWQDDKNVKGIWRRTGLKSYKRKNPKWQTILDIDVLAKTEDRNWVYKGTDCMAPAYSRCMISLSDGGKDATVRREFDIATKSFVDGGFVLPESKGSSSWLNKNTLIVGVDFGGDSSGNSTMTDSGYPRQVKLWKRGTPLSDARLLYEVDKENVGGWGYTFDTEAGRKEIVLQKSMTFYEREFYWLPRSGKNAFKPVRFPIPIKSNLAGEYKGQELVSLQEDWVRADATYKAGALVSFALADFMEDGQIDKVHEVMTPNARQSIEDYGITKSGLLVSLFEDVKGAAYAFAFDGENWQSTKMDFPENGNISISATNPKEDAAFISTESFLEPDTLWSVDAASLSAEKAKSLPAWFDASNMVSEQHFVKSSDGTDVPYFIVRNKDVVMDGTNPTLLYGYGGFHITMTPSYSATIGRAWLKRGGVYVLSNIRGGDEYGPKWHAAGLKEKRQLIYDDFIAIAEDLIEKKITSPEHLGIHGRSNGGLLMGVMFTQRPDLFKAIAIGVPLLDMHRYDKLLAGASWTGEYGDPDDEGAEGEFIRKLSPYHNIRNDVKYPEPYIYTSTKDDRVHPAHARKFAQRLEDMGLPFQYYENIDGGHAGAANLEETAHSQALIYSYFANKLEAEN